MQNMEKLFKKMQNIVNKYVKHWKGDFEYDKDIILRNQNLDEPDKERFMFWIVRECGTNIGSVSHILDSVVYDYYIDNEGIRYYELDLEKQTVKFIKDPVAYKKHRIKEAA